MSGCAAYGELIGGYVLGALEPAEMDEMRRHVAGCPHCGPEIDRLAALPGLLDRIEPADVPPPVLGAQVEEAVLDRFARERRTRARPRRRLPRGRRLGTLAVAGAVALVGLMLLVTSLGDDDRGAYASVALGGVSAGEPAEANAQLDSVPAGTRIRLHAWGLPTKGEAEYEVWCIRADGRWVSGGTFHADGDGEAEAELTAAVWPGDYHKMVVTQRPAGGGEKDRGPAVLAGALRY
jgi:anti-sigma-K factor RskA